MMCSILLGFGDYLYGIVSKTNVYSYNIVDKNGKTDPDIMAKAIIDAVNDNVDLINISLGSYFDNRQVGGIITRLPAFFCACKCHFSRGVQMPPFEHP